MYFAASTIVTGLYYSRIADLISDSSLRDLQIVVNKCGKLRFGQCTHLGAFHFTVHEQHQCRNAAYSIMLRRRWVIINVQFGYREFAIIIFGNFIQNWGNHLTRAAPFRPIINQYRACGFKYCLIKITIIHMKDEVAHIVSPTIKNFTIGGINYVVNQFSAKPDFTVSYRV